MKVLFVTPYIYAPDFDEHSKNKTGFGIMVHDISNAVSRLSNEVLVTTHTFGPKRICDGFSITENSLFKNLIHGRYKGLFKFIKNLKKSNIPLKAVIKNLYYYLNLGYIEYLIKTEKPDIVHIHGCSSVLNEITEVCRKHNVKFIVTLHGLLQDDPAAGEYLKQIEREFIRNSSVENIPVTVISSRMKERFLSEYYGADSNENVAVITNAIDVSHKKNTFNLRGKLGVGENTRIILSVGNICKLKNQIQTVKAFSLLPSALKENTVLVLVGAARDGYSISEDIDSLGLSDKVFCVGFVPRDELNNYYSAADITVTASITEGFGIPIIEGYVYGVPCVTFADLDAVPDVFDESAMLLCRERSDETLAETINKALNTQWDKDKIKSHAEKYSLEAMAQKYQQMYLKLKL